MSASGVKMKHVLLAINKSMGRNMKIKEFHAFWQSLSRIEKDKIRSDYILCQKEHMTDQFANSIFIKMNEVVDRPPIDRTPIPKPPKFIPKTVLRKPIT